MANLFTFLVGVLMFAGLIVAIARTGREEKRAQAEADAAYCAEQHLNAQRCIRDVDAMLQRIPNSPLLTAEARREWEVLKHRFATEPPARDVIEQIRVAPQNAAYVLGLEQGDPHLRAQAVMELFTEATAYGAHDVAAQILHLRTRLGSNAFTHEYAHLVGKLGPMARQRLDDDLAFAKKFEPFSRPKELTLSPPSLGHSDFLPGAGIEGFIPRYSVWHQCKPQIDLHSDSCEVTYRSTGLFFTRFIPSLREIGRLIP
ncbi:hypothetical protein CGLAU_04125 [Corynebacterium glaucum]|uniref:Uncharacterized protein n=1 Tax=Corynebacterium glaucum TaxID=187491 RepID=A0A1Q2HVC7_9CORY|nr:hypothetical protein [Corynebacterium glaucum]AQQ14801.1 hypothetical protein CGLAU_04125 [Corynebacterium glaucum]